MNWVPDHPDMLFHTSKAMSWFVLVWFAPIALFLSHAAYATNPNFVVILVDDAALMDLGGYGGEAHTPHISQLADRGVRFSNYRTSPMCAPSRAMLLTGLDSHRAGVGTLPELLSKEQHNNDAYALHLLPSVETIADQLRRSGYQTYMTGKWHLGEQTDQLPQRHGFDRSFALAASGADNWEDKSYLPFYADAPWYEDGEPVSLPERFYSSEFLVDQMVDYLQDRDRNRPFFSYIAFQAIHIPVQAPREFTRKYEGVYSDGWNALARKRFERARELGLIPPDAAPPVPHPTMRDWDSLSQQEREHYEASMMVNAGMLEAMDYHIGRLVTYLRDSGELDNTVFVITSDNGPEAGDPSRNALFSLWMRQNGYHRRTDSFGEVGYLGAIGSEWASAAAVPGSLFKMHASEGGTRVPLIISGPGVSAQTFNPARAFVTDITPTILDMAGTTAGLEAMDGRSLVPVLENRRKQVYGANDAVAMELSGNSFVLQGNYKLTRNTPPRGDGKWRLHNISRDPAERADLSDEMPELRRRMLSEYEDYARRNNVAALPQDFDVVAQVNRNIARRLIERNMLSVVIVIAVALMAAWLLIRQLRRRQVKPGRREPTSQRKTQ